MTYYYTCKMFTSLTTCTSYFLFPVCLFAVSSQFGGFAGETEYRAEAVRLTRTLGETAPYQRKQYFCCSYDVPIKPYGRRNEVWFLQEEP